MPTIEKIGGGRYYSRSTGRLTHGQRATVDDDVAEHLASRSDFVIVNGEDSHMSETTDDTTVSDPSGFDADEWMESGFKTRVEAVESGAVDEHLETVKETDRSQKVEAAVEERQTTIEEA